MSMQKLLTVGTTPTSLNPYSNGIYSMRGDKFLQFETTEGTS